MQINEHMYGVYYPTTIANNTINRTRYKLRFNGKISGFSRFFTNIGSNNIILTINAKIKISSWFIKNACGTIQINKKSPTTIKYNIQDNKFKLTGSKNGIRPWNLYKTITRLDGHISGVNGSSGEFALFANLKNIFYTVVNSTL